LSGRLVDVKRDAAGLAQREKSRRKRSTLLLRPERLLEFGKHLDPTDCCFLGYGIVS